MLDFLPNNMELKRRKLPIKLTERRDFVAVVILLMFHVFTTHNSLSEDKILDTLYKIEYINLSDIDFLNVIDILNKDKIIDFYKNGNIKLTLKGKGILDLIKDNNLFKDLVFKLKEVE